MRNTFSSDEGSEMLASAAAMDGSWFGDDYRCWSAPNPRW
jgi:hypothetical protein